ncbi:acyl-CoA thioesterase [Zhouia sp. PK063]|uniref:acyl-CoA thioesterase n=1 Tax=Zhouia sp. PK063 TaxID=3373602 RepID=UPI0037A8C0F6
MKIYEQLINVNPEDIDDLNHVNNVVYVQWIQNIAKAHWELVASPKVKQNNIWVVLNNYIEYKSPAFLNDEIYIKTYIEKANGAVSTRIVEIYNNNTKKLLANSKTNWCLLNAKSGKPMRITDDIVQLFK